MANQKNMVEPVNRAFDDVAPVYDTVLPFFARFGAEMAAWLPPSTHGDRLLDLGAGIGAVATPAMERGYGVVAVDCAAEMVMRLRVEHPEMDARVMDVASLDFEDGSFDVVAAGFVMHLLPDPVATMREVRRVLRPGGAFLFTVPGRVPDGFVFHDAANALFAEFAAHLPPDGGMGRPFAEVASFIRRGSPTYANVRSPSRFRWPMVRRCGVGCIPTARGSFSMTSATSTGGTSTAD